MSRRSAIWSAAALTVVFVLLFGTVLLRPSLDGSADVGQSVPAVVVDGGSNGDSSEVVAGDAEVSPSIDGDHEVGDDDSHSDSHEAGDDDD